MSIKNSQFPTYKVELFNRDMERIAVFSDEIGRPKNGKINFQLLQHGNCGAFDMEIHSDFDLSLIDFHYFVKIYYKNEHLYTGIVIKKPRKGGTTRLRKLSGFGLFDEMNWITITRKYNNETVEDIVADIIQNRVAPYTDIVYNGSKIIATGVTVKKMLYFGKSAKQSIQVLADMVSNYTFGVDKDKEFFFEPLETTLMKKFYVSKDVELFIPDEDSDTIITKLNIKAGKYFGSGYARAIREDSSAAVTYGTLTKEISVPELSEPDDIDIWKDRAFERLTRTKFNPQLSLYSADEIIEPKGMINVVDVDGTEYEFPVLTSKVAIHNPSVDNSLDLGYQYPTSIVDELQSIDSKREEAEKKQYSDSYSTQAQFIQESEDAGYDNILIDVFDDFTGIEDKAIYSIAQQLQKIHVDYMGNIYWMSLGGSDYGILYRINNMDGDGYVPWIINSFSIEDFDENDAHEWAFAVTGNGQLMHKDFWNQSLAAGQTYGVQELDGVIPGYISYFGNQIYYRAYNSQESSAGSTLWRIDDDWTGKVSYNNGDFIDMRSLYVTEGATPGTTHIYWSTVGGSIFRMDDMSGTGKVQLYSDSSIEINGLEMSAGGCLLMGGNKLSGGIAVGTCVGNFLLPTIDKEKTLPDIPIELRDISVGKFGYLHVGVKQSATESLIIKDSFLLNRASRKLASDINDTPVVSTLILHSVATNTVMLHAEYTGIIDFYVSRDDGITWTSAAVSTDIDISSQPAGVCYRMRAEMDKSSELKGWGLSL